MKSVNCSVDVLYILSVSTVLGEGVGVVRPKQSSAFFVPDRYLSSAFPACESFSYSLVIAIVYLAVCLSSFNPSYISP